jgi:methylated-DNA-[protein]-cysteine S-methyltransferase
VDNRQGDEHYTLVPGANDGEADGFGVGDLWALRKRPGEIDDGVTFTTDPQKARAHLDPFVTGQSLDGDVFLWYAAHFSPVSDAEKRQVEDLVNADIRANADSKIDVLPIDQAKQRGAVAMFGGPCSRRDLTLAPLARFEDAMRWGDHQPDDPRDPKPIGPARPRGEGRPADRLRFRRSRRRGRISCPELAAAAGRSSSTSPGVPGFDLPLAPQGTDFQQQVWLELLRIPYGATMSYGEIARRLGDPTASRAVGAANGRNPLPILLPCHRVVGAGGRLIGYGGGLDRKAQLLALEAGQLQLAMPA